MSPRKKKEDEDKSTNKKVGRPKGSKNKKDKKTTKDKPKSKSKSNARSKPKKTKKAGNNNRQNKQLSTPLKKQKFLQVLEKNPRNITKACEKANIGRATYYKWIESDEEFKQKIEALNESFADLAESMLYALVKKKNIVAIRFVLLNMRGEKWKPEKLIDNKILNQINTGSGNATEKLSNDELLMQTQQFMRLMPTLIQDKEKQKVIDIKSENKEEEKNDEKISESNAAPINEQPIELPSQNESPNE